MDKKCLSNLRGAKYTTTEVQVFEDKLISWDRGFTDTGFHAWGATAGGYIFDKIK
ncbi:MAG: CpcT/CpeT family chromophore lyase [Chitinophagales bacterium]